MELNILYLFLAVAFILIGILFYYMNKCCTEVKKEIDEFKQENHNLKEIVNSNITHFSALNEQLQQQSKNLSDKLEFITIENTKIENEFKQQIINIQNKSINIEKFEIFKNELNINIQNNYNSNFEASIKNEETVLILKQYFLNFCNETKNECIEEIKNSVINEIKLTGDKKPELKDTSISTSEVDNPIIENINQTYEDNDNKSEDDNPNQKIITEELVKEGIKTEDFKINIVFALDFSLSLFDSYKKVQFQNFLSIIFELAKINSDKNEFEFFFFARDVCHKKIDFSTRNLTDFIEENLNEIMNKIGRDNCEYFAVKSIIEQVYVDKTLVIFITDPVMDGEKENNKRLINEIENNNLLFWQVLIVEKQGDNYPNPCLIDVKSDNFAYKEYDDFKDLNKEIFLTETLQKFYKWYKKGLK